MNFLPVKFNLDEMEKFIIISKIHIRNPPKYENVVYMKETTSIMKNMPTKHTILSSDDVKNKDIKEEIILSYPNSSRAEKMRDDFLLHSLRPEKP